MIPFFLDIRKNYSNQCQVWAPIPSRLMDGADG
jgi:hypothetical protein